MKQPEPISLDDWRELYYAAMDFRNLKPWQWMYDTDLFGVRNPEDDKTGYCCIMGKLGEFRALALYIGSEGLETYRKILAGDTSNLETQFSQKCLMASFEDSDDLDEEDMAVINELGIDFSGAGQWPVFRNHQPGYIPWFLSLYDVKFLTLALHQAIQVAEKARKNKRFLRPPAKGQYLVMSFEKGKWQEQYQAPLPAEKKVIKPLMDLTLLEEIKKEKPERHQEWEICMVHLPTAVREMVERPYYPYVILIVKKDNGENMGFEIAEPAKINMKLPSLFLKTIKEQKALPELISFEEEMIHDLLAPAAAGLKIKLKQVKKLTAVEEMLNGLISMIMAGQI